MRKGPKFAARHEEVLERIEQMRSADGRLAKQRLTGGKSV